MGTAVLILLGNGVVANVLLKRSKAEGAGWLAIAAGWAFAVVFGVFTAIACGSPDAYINPAFTLRYGGLVGRFFEVSVRSWWRRCWARSWARSWSGCTSCPIGV